MKNYSRNNNQKLSHQHKLVLIPILVITHLKSQLEKIVLILAIITIMRLYKN